MTTPHHCQKHFCEQAFLIDLTRVSWKDIDLIPSVEDAWLFFKSTFLTILNKHAPFKKCRTKNRYSLWFTPDLTALDQHKNILLRTALASNSPFSGKSGTKSHSQIGKQRLAFQSEMCILQL